MGLRRRLADLRQPWHSSRALVAVLLGLVVITLFDIWARDRVELSPLLVAAPAIAASFGGPGLVAVMGALTVVCQVIIATVHGDLGSLNHTVQMAALALVSCLIVFYCRQRERRARELERVRSVSEATQQVVLRPLPHRMGPLRIASCYLAAEDEAQIGGDLYAATRTEEGTRLIVGDVRGKGLTAISDAATLMGAFREAAPRCATLAELADILEESVCRHLAEYAHHPMAGELAEHFITALLLDIPDESSRVQAINCGHPSPLLLRGGDVTLLEADVFHPPLGMCTLPRGRWTTDVFAFEDDDTLLLHTDGVVEARAPDGSFYPLAERVARWTDLGPEAMLHHIRDDVLRHTGGRLGDDAAMVVIQRLPALAPVRYLQKAAHADGDHRGTAGPGGLAPDPTRSSLPAATTPSASSAWLCGACGSWECSAAILEALLNSPATSGDDRGAWSSVAEVLNRVNHGMGAVCHPSSKRMGLSPRLERATCGGLMYTTRSFARSAAICAATTCMMGVTALPAIASSSSSPSVVSPLDRQLLTAAHQGNLWEIATGEQAQSAATTACVKRVGADFIRDHRTLDAGVVKTAAKLGVALPSGQTNAQLKQTAVLKSHAGTPAYDAAWLKAQYPAHVQTLALIDKEIASGTNPLVKSLAKSARPVVARHTQMVNHGVCHA